MNRKAILILITILSALTFSACGGSSSGGGGETSTSTCVWDSSTTWDNCSWGP